MNDAEKLAAIKDRIDLSHDEDGDKWSAQPGYVIEDIERILDGEEPMSTRINLRR